MMSLCAQGAVATNKSSLVRVRGWDVLIALLIQSFAPPTAPDKHIRETEEKAYGLGGLQPQTLIASQCRRTKL